MKESRVRTDPDVKEEQKIGHVTEVEQVAAHQMSPYQHASCEDAMHHHWCTVHRHLAAAFRQDCCSQLAAWQRMILHAFRCRLLCQQHHSCCSYAKLGHRKPATIHGQSCPVAVSRCVESWTARLDQPSGSMLSMPPYCCLPTKHDAW